MEISDPDRLQPSSNDGGLCDVPYDIQRAERPSSAPYTHPVTYRAFPNEDTFRRHPLNSRRQHQDDLPIRFPEERYTLHTTREQQVEADLFFIRNFRTASNVLNPNRITPYVITIFRYLQILQTPDTSFLQLLHMCSPEQWVYLLQYQQYLVHLQEF